MRGQCERCGAMFEPRGHTAKARFQWRKRRVWGWACQVEAQRKPRKTRSVASKYARRLKPKAPCEICGETRQSQVHHRDGDYMNNAVENLMRLCQWCHGVAHRGPAASERACRGWATKRRAVR